MRDDEPAFDGATPDVPDESTPWTTNGSAPPDGLTADASAEPTAEPTPEPTAEPTADDGTAFLADLARAMQTTAGAEHIRVSEDTERRRQAHLDTVRAREATEADELSVVAEEGVKGIDAWADTEIERIQRERERRILARRRDLETSLEDHRALVAREVDAVEAAIVAYRAEIETYFGRLGAESDPVAIASQAGSRPVFPALEAIGPDNALAEAAIPSGEPVGGGEPSTPDADGGDTTASAVPGDADEGAAMVGVMDGSEPATSAAPEHSEPKADRAGEPGTEPDQPIESPQASGVMPRSSAALLQAVPSLRPMSSWFRREGEHSKRSDDESPSG